MNKLTVNIVKALNEKKELKAIDLMSNTNIPLRDLAPFLTLAVSHNCLKVIEFMLHKGITRHLNQAAQTALYNNNVESLIQFQAFGAKLTIGQVKGAFNHNCTDAFIYLFANKKIILFPLSERNLKSLIKEADLRGKDREAMLLRGYLPRYFLL